ncbi:hypothetical protein [Aeromicrobium sp. 179-A 4D2 NHS]|uniref:hypothetical protein n=1 Tax=Aeromicrobium sp. 179-A 4D2 NHS TaxID=3142375 RepID=UPI0039A245E9
MFIYEPERHETLFETPTGSRLYGNARPDSDFDLFRVIVNDPHRKRARNAAQTMKYDPLLGRTDDVTVVDLSTFMTYASMGVPQYVEAAYSRIPTVDRLGEAFRLSLRPTLASARSKYSGAIAHHWTRGSSSGDVKTLRHTHRMAYQWVTFVSRGLSFNPTLTAEEWALVEADLNADPFERWGLESTETAEKTLAKALR